MPLVITLNSATESRSGALLDTVCPPFPAVIPSTKYSTPLVLPPLMRVSDPPPARLPSPNIARKDQQLQGVALQLRQVLDEPIVDYLSGLGVLGAKQRSFSL